MERGITVYCGSAAGRNPLFAEAATAVGSEIARLGLPLYYGGGHMGLMGAVGKAVREAGGRAVAIIPQFMVERGWNDPAASDTVVTPSMHVRKQTMAECAVGIIAMPGGVGTFEELCEIITWRQLGLFGGNIVVLNVAGYYDAFIAQFDRAVTDGFFLSSHRALFDVTDNPAEAVALAARTDISMSVEAKF